eukprot:353088-Chlamydomonas_euryale.AAC.22
MERTHPQPRRQSCNVFKASKFKDECAALCFGWPECASGVQCREREREKPYKLISPELVPTVRNPTPLGLTTSNLIESRQQQRKDRQGQASPPAKQQEPSSPSETKPHPAGKSLRAGPNPTPAKRCLL